MYFVAIPNYYPHSLLLLLLNDIYIYKYKFFIVRTIRNDDDRFAWTRCAVPVHRAHTLPSALSDRNVLERARVDKYATLPSLSLSSRPNEQKGKLH